VATISNTSALRCSRVTTYTKNLVERPLAFVFIVVLLPLFLLCGIAVWRSSPGPIFHRRRVVGQGGVEFDAFKFRTMVANADDLLARDPQLRHAFAVNHKLVHDPRVTTIGRFLRRYSLDELPQLWNVVRGEMWLIGPRMVTAEELVRYGDGVETLLSMKPGMTGLWQVSGRQTTTYERRVELDLQYVREWHFGTDLEILARTVAEVLRARGAH
jgi:lipopolysaccharide/colanic/teichoic acid biosynthesis glycosyltransferase